MISLWYGQKNNHSDRATSGIGKVTATTLAKKGHHVILLARNRQKTDRVQRDIMKASKNDQVDILICDLADQQSILKAADWFNTHYPRLDVLVNNAGLILGKERETTSDDIEMTLAINHLATFLLTRLLLDKLLASPGARVVNVSSAAYKMAKPDFSDLQMEKDYSPWKAYSNSKLFNIMFTHELARRLKPHPSVTTNCLHPGVIASGFGKSSNGLVAFMLNLARPFMTSPEKGAETSIYLATSNEAAGHSGEYFVKKKPEKPSHPFLTEDNEKMLWSVSESLTGGKFL